MRAAPSVSGRHPKTFTTPDIGALGQKVAFVPGTDLMHCSNERPYSMTSSASASDVGGTSRPSALALWR
jgi:hypothetical protein